MSDRETGAGGPPASRSAGEIWRKLGPAGWLAILAATLPALGGFVLLGITPTVGPWLRGHEGAGIALYIGAFALLSGFALLPTYAQAILGGWAFGFAIGFPAALCGFLGGSIIGYVVARRAASENVMDLIREKPQWLAVREALVGGGLIKTLGIVSLVRLPPNSPFAMTNLVLGSTRVAVLPFLIGTAVGMAPRTAAAVFIAGSVSDLTQRPEQPRWMIVAGIALAVAVIVVIGAIANRAFKRVTGGGASGQGAGQQIANGK